MYRALADLTIVVHLAFMAFVVCGGLWARRRRWLVPVHLAALGWGVLSELNPNVICPLTALQKFFAHRAGCAAQTVANAAQAFHLAQKEKFDLITLDVNMPGMSGFELCRRLKQIGRLRETPIIFVSGQSNEDHIRRGYEAGAADYITKPFLPTEFVSRILSHIRSVPKSAACPGKGMDAEPQSI
jgi:CheY-like chemotaxis protein